MSPYHASKWAVEAVADSLRRELRPWRIKVVVVEPGNIATPLWDKTADYGDTARAALPRQAQKDYGAPLEILTDMFKMARKDSTPPEKVAEVVRKALTRRFPDTRYRVGMDARMAFAASRLLGDRLFDRVVARRLKQRKVPR
jgi:NAD(P)-dependent dehydrogenase (short-subunit alcohol dehydrogenase family)